jgi:hypothetical protein
LVHCPPQVVAFFIDGNEHLIQVPFITRTRTAPNLRRLFPGARLGTCLRQALIKLPKKFVAIASPVRKALRTQFHTLWYWIRQRKGLRVFALGQRLRRFADHVATTAGAVNGERGRRHGSRGPTRPWHAGEDRRGAPAGLPGPSARAWLSAVVGAQAQVSPPEGPSRRRPGRRRGASGLARGAGEPAKALPRASAALEGRQGSRA